MKPLAAAVLGLSFVLGGTICRAADETAQVVHTNKARFRIPYRFDAAEMQAIGAREIRLYLSTDQGFNWQHAQTVQPAAGRFVFEAEADGEYWFAVRTLDGRNQLYPQAGISDPGLKVVVDTSQPQLDLELSQPQPGKVQLNWNVDDANVDLSTLRLEYMQAENGDWQPVHIVPEPSGQTAWTVSSGGFVAVRGTVSDRASNSTASEQQIRIDSVQAAPVQQNTRPNFREPIASDYEDSGMASTTITPHNSAQAPSMNPLASNPLAGNPLGGSYQADSSFQSDSFQSGDGYQHDGGFETQTADNSTEIESFDAVPEPGPANSWSENFVSDSPATRPAIVQPRAARSLGNDASGMRVVNAHKFQINYKVEDVGPSGVGSVEMFITQDGGRKWYKYGDDPNRTTPFDVEVPNDGEYGFAIRVRSGQGLAADPPQPGEKPSVTVVVDSTAPTAQLLSAEQGKGPALDKILIRWNVSDDYLVDEPIHLSYATTPGGPWEPIGGWQPNSGNFVWSLGAGVPAKLFIRLTARDAAGNISRVETPQPVVVDLAKPSAKIVDVEITEPGGRRF